jgi:hypothetical protein
MKCKHCNKKCVIYNKDIFMLCNFRKFGACKSYYIVQCKNCNKFCNYITSKKSEDAITKDILKKKRIYLSSNSCKCRRPWNERLVLLGDVPDVTGGRTYLCPVCSHKRSFRYNNMPRYIKKLIKN